MPLAPPMCSAGGTRRGERADPNRGESRPNREVGDDEFVPALGLRRTVLPRQPSGMIVEVRRTNRNRGGHLSAIPWLPILLVLLVPLAALAVVRSRGGTTADVAAATAVAIAIAGVLDRFLDRLRGEQAAPGVPLGLSREVVESWRSTLRHAVVQERIDGQLHDMVGAHKAMDLKVRVVDSESRRPRLLVRGELRPWHEITHEWDRSDGRVVILGDPGYGKTVAALTLLAHLNRSDSPGSAVAELFSLADWYRWQADTPGSAFGEWLAYQLALAYPKDLPQTVSRWLVDEGLVLPILDGLDDPPRWDAGRVWSRSSRMRDAWSPTVRSY